MEHHILHQNILMKIIKKHIGSGKINKLLSHIVGYSVLIFLFICLLFILRKKKSYSPKEKAVLKIRGSHCLIY